MNILSWNVLLRDHEETYNPDSEILFIWPNENYRENKIINMIEQFSDENSIITLQEVSFSLLNKLTHTFANKTVFTHKITNNEFLVTLTPFSFKKEEWTQNETANGYLVTATNKLRIINTHLIPQRYTKHNVLKYILNLPTDICNIVCGDFNENWKKVKLSVEHRYIVPFFGNTYKKRHQI